MAVPSSDRRRSAATAEAARRDAAAPDTPNSDRRRGDRRRGGTDPAPNPPRDESWFGALGVDASASDDLSSGESRLETGWASPSNDPSNSRFLSRQARRLITPQANAFQRIFKLFVGARAGVGVALVAALAVGSVFGVGPALVPLLVSIGYASLALILWLLPSLGGAASRLPTRLSRTQWALTIGLDLLAFSSLHLLSAGQGFNFVALLVLPVLMAGVLMSRLLALATASAATLILLGSAWYGAVAGSDVTLPLAQAGFAGIGFFVVTLLAGELATWLAREELSARGSLELARQQAQLNRLVIEEMSDGVLVVDRRARVRAANPAARRLLASQGLGDAAPFQLQGFAPWAQLHEAVARAFEEGQWPEAVRTVALSFPDGASRTLHLRARFTRRRPGNGSGAADSAQAAEEFCVLFVEDERSVQARSRQEKLAAMGRVSAGIAHEIRNPLAAIAQANALLQEDAVTPSQERLTRMVAENVDRLKRIVDDVMEVAPGAAPTPRVIDATAEVADGAAEWARTTQTKVGDSGRLWLVLPPEPLPIVFDPDHLRRVLVNLLDNAQRHASAAPGAIVLSLAREGHARVCVSVDSDGPPIAPDVERHLFEPFFSTRSRGTGLGLYICRELCERYGARIDYRQRGADEARRNRFEVAMRASTTTAAAAQPG